MSGTAGVAGRDRSNAYFAPPSGRLEQSSVWNAGPRPAQPPGREIHRRVPSGPQSIVVNELLADAAGVDEGHEFVELYNSSGEEVQLSGVSLQVWRGTRGWKTVWTGSGADHLLPAHFFLLAGDSVADARDALLDGDLSNASGAVRLFRNGSAWSVVGWGPLADAGLFEGEPCARPPAGHSLARLPDGVDTHWNTRDWIDAAVPTPGRRNGSPGPSLASHASLVDPALPWPGEEAALRILLTAVGQGPQESRGWRLKVTVDGPLTGGATANRPDTLSIPLPLQLTPGETTTVSASWLPRTAGLYRVQTTLTSAFGDADSGEVVVRVGRGPLVFSEVMYAPSPGEPEWIEIWCGSPSPLDLSSYTLIGPRGTRTPLPPHPLRPGGRVVVCRSTEELLRTFGDADTAAVVQLREKFPALPAASGSSRAEHRLSLVDTAGVVSDAVVYDAVRTGSGHSLERVDLEGNPADANSWQPCVAPPGGTPGRSNSAVLSRSSPPQEQLWVDGALQRDDPDRPVSVHVALGSTPCAMSIGLYSLGGRLVRKVAQFASVRGELTLPLSVRDQTGETLAPGLYALVLDTQDLPSGRLKRRAVTVTVGER
jgi:hypothetical protein